MYQCKLPFNPHDKFGKGFPNVSVKYLSMWNIEKELNGMTYIYKDDVRVVLPTSKFDIHFREKE